MAGTCWITHPKFTLKVVPEILSCSNCAFFEIFLCNRNHNFVPGDKWNLTPTLSEQDTFENSIILFEEIFPETLILKIGLKMNFRIIKNRYAAVSEIGFPIISRVKYLEENY